MSIEIETLSHENTVISASDIFKNSSPLSEQDFRSASSDRLAFWEEQARKLDWFSPWESVLEWNRPYATWFKNGTLNASYNCIDTHVNQGKGSKTAILWEGELGAKQSFTYDEVLIEVQKMAFILKHHFNIQKGDRVTIYLPMIPELIFAVLACARIGAIHSVVFAGFSSNSLRDRIEDSSSKLVITADGGSRRGQTIPLKEIVDEALDHPSTSSIQAVLVVKQAENTISMKEGRDFLYHHLCPKETVTVPAEAMDSEDPLFILYTSGTTGKPKGIVHSTGGYMTHAKYSTKTVFDLKDDDIYFCTADIGWITGHTYMVYGPMANAATIVMYEGAPDYPNKDRFWELIDTYQATIFYTAPTAIRAFMKWGDQYPAKHTLSSLRLLGTVGEPINPEAWMWYYTVIGHQKCPIVDTWWQTETGGIMISTLPALHDMKPGIAGRPLPGISAEILNHDGNRVSEGGGFLSLTEPWPSMLRGIWGDDDRFKEVYWSRFNSYFAGDGATIDHDGYIKVLGRVDDVLNVAGHRIGTMEVESAIVNFEGVAEAAVVGIEDEIKGQAVLAYVTLKEGVQKTDTLDKDIIQFVGKEIGAIAKPKFIVFTPELPKTRSGKIMRRVLKNIAANKDVGDVTTLANPAIVDSLVSQLKENIFQK